MRLNDIFAKDVQRPIQGVIKADDISQLSTEVEEYVLTNEASKEVEKLLEAYTNYNNANGVWISGFFGSGKSHLLKMMAHLLGDVEGQEFDRSAVVRTFQEKADNAILKALLTKSERIAAKSLLFNIDQKATVITKDQTDALLKVFVKVFNEARGYYGDQGHVARFERQLDDDDLFEAFKAAFAERDLRGWTVRRSSFGLPQVRKQVNEAYAQVTGVPVESGVDILSTYQSTYEVSIEDFAEEVSAWLDKQPTGYRLNFFVDEVGQFIGTNTHLMLNLQTIVESLNTKCGGRAWVFVTSQEDMDKVVGDRTKQQGNDFSKIQARFQTRMKLSSSDVEEVIRKRLLEKNATGTVALEDLYTAESVNFRTLFDFVDGATTYRNYFDEEHFIGTYPFVPYQFSLFQAAIEGISDHNVFEGRNSSVGERSMLGVVQQVAKDIGNVEVGHLASFDHMFAGIRTSLKSAAQRSILRAEQNLDNPLAIRLLKALFLVKYVDGFHATPRNLTVLMYDRFGLDLPALLENVKETLALLEAQTYVQRNGQMYAYLTNEEQEIEEAIKNIDIDSSEVGKRLYELLLNDVIKTRKLRYTKNGQDFSFAFQLDDQVHGPAQDLSIHFITPEYPASIDEIRLQSTGRDELRVLLRTDDRLFADLRRLMKTEKYIKRVHTTSLSAIEEQILRSKAAINIDRAKEVAERLQQAVGNADMIINAEQLDVSAGDALNRVSAGFQVLVERTYPQLQLLGGASYTETEVAPAADPARGLFPGGIPAPAMEIDSAILRRENHAEQVTMKMLVDQFQGKPYGWDLAAIEVMIASLVGASKVSLTIDGNLVRRSEVAPLLRNTQKHQHIVVSRRKSFDEHTVAAFRTFYTEFFDDGNPPSDPLELAHQGATRLADKAAELDLLTKGKTYPFLSELQEPITLLKQVIGKPDDWYLTSFSDSDALLDAKEQTIDPIVSFMNGHQREIYDEAASLLTSQRNNLTYLDHGIADDVASRLQDPQAFRGARMNQLKTAAEALREALTQQIGDRRTQVIQAIESRRMELTESTDYQRATAEAQSQVNARIDHVVQELDRQDQIALILQTRYDFEQQVLPSLYDELAASRANGEAPSEPRVTVSIRSLSVPDVHAVLQTSEDVDEYLAVLRHVLVQTLDDGKRIAL